MATVDAGFDNCDETNPKWLADNLQGLYQDLGLDPIVSNLELEKVDPNLRALTQATQASAVSSLMELGSMRSEPNGSPLKRSRGSNGFQIPEVLECASKNGRRETPVRKRHNVDGSPTSKRSLSGFDSPTACHDPSYVASSIGVNWTPRQSPRCRNGEDDSVQNAVAALLGTPKSCDRNGKGVRKKNGKHSPGSDDESARSPPPAAPGSNAGKGTRPNGMPAGANSVGNGLLLNDKDKKNQGLRQFSLRVCRQVEAKMTTTYNEVADELVKEFKDEETDSDEKNIRRRAYDALNVLTAMDIISKDKKDIQWKGFPPMVGDSSERTGGPASGRDKEKARLKERIEQKSKELRQKEGHLKELVNQFVNLKQLLGRNQRPEYVVDPDSEKHQRIHLPFVIVNTDSDNTIECVISDDKRSAQFDCTKPFKLFDDRETLSLMRMGQCDEDTLAKMLPDPSLVDFLKAEPGSHVQHADHSDLRDGEDGGECEEMEDDEP